MVPPQRPSCRPPRLYGLPLLIKVLCQLSCYTNRLIAIFSEIKVLINKACCAVARPNSDSEYGRILRRRAKDSRMVRYGNQYRKELNLGTYSQ